MGKVGSLKLKLTKSDKSVQKTAAVTVTQKPAITQKQIDTLAKAKKTPAQMAFEAAQLKKRQEKLPLLASKSHKEKVADFNEYLGKLSEHHDIPRVGPG